MTPDRRIPDDERTEKACTHCGEVKPLGDPRSAAFYVKWNTRLDGSRQYYWSPECRECRISEVKAKREAKMATMGEAAYRAHERAILERSREKQRRLRTLERQARAEIAAQAAE